jgi:hypothetical protein
MTERGHARIEGTLEAETQDGQLTGVIWATGTHDLRLNGEPARVTVTDSSLATTFEHLEASLPVPIGFDHPSPNSVAAETDLGTIGEVTDVELSADKSQIVMTESEITNDVAKQSLETGQLSNFDYSIVGSFDTDGESGGEPLITAAIGGVDLVDRGAVASASVGNMPPLAAAAVADNPGDLAKSRDYIEAFGHAKPWMGETPIDAIRDLQRDAIAVIEAKDEKIEELQAAQSKANAFDEAAGALGIDSSKDADARSQSLIDNATQSLRQECESLAASCPNENLEADDLRGHTVEELEAKAGELARKANEHASHVESEKSNAIARSGEASIRAGVFENSDRKDFVEKISDAVLTATESKTAERKGSAADVIRDNYGIDPSEHDDQHDLQQAISAVRRGEKE